MLVFGMGGSQIRVVTGQHQKHVVVTLTEELNEHYLAPVASWTELKSKNNTSKTFATIMFK